MDRIGWVVKRGLVPGSLAFLLLGLVIGIVLLYRPRCQRWGRRCLTAVDAMYWLMSVPLGGERVGDAAELWIPSDCWGGRNAWREGNRGPGRRTDENVGGWKGDCCGQPAERPQGA